MRTDMVVVATPGFDHDTRFLAAPEPFELQALVAELAVEALVGAVLPRLTAIDQWGFDLFFAEPFEDCVADKLRAVIRAKESRRAMLRDQAVVHLDDATGSDGGCDVERQALPGELVDHCQALDLLTESGRGRRLPAGSVQQRQRDAPERVVERAAARVARPGA